MKFLLVDIFAILNSAKFQHRKIHNDGDISLWPIWNLILNQKVLTHFILSLESSDIIGSVNWQNYLAYIKFIEFLIYFFSHDT